MPAPTASCRPRSCCPPSTASRRCSRGGHITALAEQTDTWPTQAHNLLAFGPPGAGKTHLIAGIGHALIDRGYRVLFQRTFELVQRLQAARRHVRLPAELAKLDRYDLQILDDLSYAKKDQAETSVLFELIAERCERKSIAVNANAPFSQWDAVFPDKAITVAAVDRLVHHLTILERTWTATDAELRCRRAGNAAHPQVNETFPAPPRKIIDAEVLKIVDAGQAPST